ncbi:hypothetical protein [Flavobacterium sp.]|jgi:hypothetical protein|uniref:hypothetical protein n=1 Tax=Flavobacterium sp. TaxID=239 RepID=UPI0037C041E0
MNNSIISNLKKGIWLYFFLLIFEGALRRWVIPSLASPLLLIRDVLAVYLLIIAIRNNYYPSNRIVPLVFLIGIISIFTALFFGHGNLFVALYGARILMIQFPMLFLIGHIFNKQDVIDMGKVILWLAIPMTILITMQFYSPQSAWVNKGVGDNIEGAGFSGANGYMRPPGTFSFTTGNVTFFCLVACYVFYFWLKPQLINKYLLIASSLALLVAIPTSISRTLFFQVFISTLFFIWAKSSQPGFLKNFSQIVIGISIITILFLNFDGLNDQIGAFWERFTKANEVEGGLRGVFMDRFLGGLVSSFFSIDDKNIVWGQGIGMGTNVGSQLLTGKLSFLIAEGEWGRIIGESGMVLGLLIVLIRIQLSFNLLYKSFIKLINGDELPWILVSYGFLLLLQGLWAQPSNLGFYVLTGGLLISSLKTNEDESIEEN